MSLLGSETISRKRYSGTQTYTKGKANARSSSTVSISAVVLSCDGDMLEMLQLSEREKDIRCVLSETSLENGDILTISGETFKVIKVFNNERHGFLEHYSCLAIKEKEE